MEKHRVGRDAIGAVVFARQTPPPWITALFRLAGELTGEIR
jgi:hypothetical protein